MAERDRILVVRVDVGEHLSDDRLGGHRRVIASELGEASDVDEQEGDVGGDHVHLTVTALPELGVDGSQPGRPHGPLDNRHAQVFRCSGRGLGERGEQRVGLPRRHAAGWREPGQSASAVNHTAVPPAACSPATSAPMPTTSPGATRKRSPAATGQSFRPDVERPPFAFEVDDEEELMGVAGGR